MKLSLFLTFSSAIEFNTELKVSKEIQCYKNSKEKRINLLFLSRQLYE